MVKFGDVSKGKVNHPGMEDCWVMSGYVLVRHRVVKNGRLNFRSYTSFMGIPTSRVPQTFIVTKCHIEK